MLASIVARSIRLAARWSVRILAAAFVALLIATALGLFLGWAGLTLVGGAAGALLDGAATGVDAARLLTIAVPIYGMLLIVQAWSQLVPIRAATGKHRLRDSLLGAIPGALRALPLLLLLITVQALLLLLEPSGVLALVASVVLLVPTLVALGTLALDPGRWGLGDFLRLGVLRIHRHVGATLAAVVVLALAVTLAALLAVAFLTMLVGPVPFDDLADPLASERYLSRLPIAAMIAGLAGALPLLLLVPALVVATREVVIDGPTVVRDEDDEAVVPTGDISPAVQQLLGTPAVRPQRLTVPPRAEHPGRVPGPGVLQVAGVDLPPGRHTRPVRTGSLELDARDAEPGDDPARDDRLWIASRPSSEAPATWKRLAAGFAESGLWPLLVPGSASLAGDEWFDAPATELPPRDGIDAATVVRARLAASLPGSPLASVERLASTGAARGSLVSGGGRRADAFAQAADRVGPARLALVPARRPADVVVRLAWPGADLAGIPADELAELLASWESRWGALLVALDARQLTFAVLRPPATPEQAVEALAEQHALQPDHARHWRDDEHEASLLVDAPVWQLGWS